MDVTHSKLVMRSGFRGGQCLITVQLPYNSACISIFTAPC